MVGGKGEESILTRGLEEVGLKKEVGEILVIWREVPPGQRTVAGTEKLRGGIWEEVFQGESRGIQEETPGIQGAGSWEEEDQMIETDRAVSQPRLKVEVVELEVVMFSIFFQYLLNL